MKGISLIFHESNHYIKTGAIEYIQKHFPRIQIIAQPLNIAELCDAMQATEADIILTDMLCDLPPLQLCQRFIDTVNSIPVKPAIIFWGVTPYVNHYFHQHIAHKVYGINKDISLKKLDTLFQKLCTGGDLTHFELESYSPDKPLSEREFIVINKLKEGMTVQALSCELNIHTKTVSTHKRNALRKLKIRSLGCLFMYK